MFGSFTEPFNSVSTTCDLEVSKGGVGHLNYDHNYRRVELSEDERNDDEVDCIR